MTVRCPPKSKLRRALEVAQAKNFRTQVTVSGQVELVTPDGVVLDERAINALARELEIAREQEAAA